MKINKYNVYNIAMFSKLITILASISVVDSTNIYNYYELAVQKWCSTDYMIHGLGRK